MDSIKDRLSIPEDQVRDELKSILASPGFFRAARMQRFLTFIVEGRFRGKHISDELKESLIGVAVFDRPADYDPKSDPVVRVEARRLRHKLDEYYEGAGKENLIRITIPKGSYVPSWGWQNPEAKESEPIPPPPPPPSRLRWLTWGIVAALASVVLGLFLFTSARSRQVSTAAQHPSERDFKIHSLAVLPFRNLSADPRQEFLINGLTDEIITDLAKIKALTVISRTSTENYRDSKKSLPQIARELNVEAVVEGTVQTSGERVVVRAQLIRAATDGHLWAETYERETNDIFSLQSEIARDIARQIGVTLEPSNEETPADRPNSREAYETYLKARYFWNERTLEGLQKSIGYYQRAIEIDPNYASAYAGLADSYVLLSSYGGPSPSESLARAREAAEKAVKLDASLAQAYTALAAVKIDQDFDWPGATKEFEQAIQLSPGYPTAHHWYALHLSRLGMHDEAEAQILRALELDPLSLIINTDAGEVFYAAGMPDHALVHLRRVLELDPNFAEAHLVLGKVYEETGEFDRAANEFEAANRIFGDLPNVSALRGSALALAGKRGDALHIAKSLEQLGGERYVSGVDIAIVYCALGDRDQAMNWLDKAYETRGKGLDILGSDPLFDKCRSDPRFEALLNRLQLSAIRKRSQAPIR